jgi:hypothetical protein
MLKDVVHLFTCTSLDDYPNTVFDYPLDAHPAEVLLVAI